jgi:chromosome segregation ATPase
LLLVGVIAAAGVIVLKGTKFFGYAKHEVAEWKDWADDQVPVEKKIAQMRKDVAALDKDLETVKTELATSIVKVRELTADTNDLQAAVKSEQDAVLARGEAIKDATEKVELRKGTFISVPDAKERLTRDVAILKTKKVQLDAMQKSLAEHQRIKATLEGQFESLRTQKRELATQIDAVEAEYKALQLQQIESKYQTDDSRLARIKENLRKMRTKLDVEKEKLKLTPKVHEAPASTAGPEQSVDEILAPLTK